MNVPHPIPYQGSKRNLAPMIVGYFPKDATRLIEPFAGSAAVSLYAALHGNVDAIVLNDLNQPLVHLWNVILRKPEALATTYQQLWEMQQGRERRFYDLVRQRFNTTRQPYYLLYLMARCVKAAVRYNANGEFNQSPDNRRKGRQPKAMRADILQASALLAGKTDLRSVDYREVLAQAKPSDIIYLDPPYQGVCASRDPRYFQGVAHNVLVDSLSELVRRNISFILSYDGRTGTKAFGEALPESLKLKRIEVNAGRSSQATLLGRAAVTYESLYLSPALVERINPLAVVQLLLFGVSA